jgi:hypothetical protein
VLMDLWSLPSWGWGGVRFCTQVQLPCSKLRVGIPSSSPSMAMPGMGWAGKGPNFYFGEEPAFISIFPASHTVSAQGEIPSNIC